MNKPSTLLALLFLSFILFGCGGSLPPSTKSENPSPSEAQAAAKPKVLKSSFDGRLAVMPLEDRSGSLDKKLIGDLTNYIRSRLTSGRQVVVIDRTRQAAKLKELLEEEKKESYKACYAKECQIPLGQALSADHILRTTLAQIGSIYSLSIEVVDLVSETTMGGASAECPADPKKGRVDRLLQIIREAVDSL